ncbi:MAG: hypothetical protein DRH57_01475 [Candidatus Cloacimonadota bacterium]|nr:MAG: hypothetical protein DRH57_01475 [Candidatus Cloacimonadota bacterium]
MERIATIKRITKLLEKREKYDITVEENHNFFANNILVHNSCLKGHEGVFARSHALPTKEPWYDHLKGVYYSKLSVLKPNYWIFGENTFAIHSIEYTEMESYFYIFAIYDTDTNTWLSYDDMVAEAKRIDIPTVPLLFRGTVMDMAWVNKWMDKYMKGQFSLLGGPLEGFVLRIADAIPGDKFQEFVAKYVREGHVQTSKHWKVNWKPQKLKVD